MHTDWETKSGSLPFQSPGTKKCTMCSHPSWAYEMNHQCGSMHSVHSCFTTCLVHQLVHRLSHSAITADGCHLRMTFWLLVKWPEGWPERFTSCPLHYLHKQQASGVLPSQHQLIQQTSAVTFANYYDPDTIGRGNTPCKLNKVPGSCKQAVWVIHDGYCCILPAPTSSASRCKQSKHNLPVPKPVLLIHPPG